MSESPAKVETHSPAKLQTPESRGDKEMPHNVYSCTATHGKCTNPYCGWFSSVHMLGHGWLFPLIFQMTISNESDLTR